MDTQETPMTQEVMLWVLGALLAPTLAWAIHTTWMIGRIREENSELLKMHKKPDEYGFGTAQQNIIITDNTRAMRELAHYIRWMTKHQTGEEPPPFVSHGV